MLTEQKCIFFLMMRMWGDRRRFYAQVTK